MSYTAATATSEIAAITSTAARLGANLPDDLAAQARHLEQLQEQHRTQRPPTPAHAAAAIAAHLGDTTATTKALTKAAADLATAEAQQRILSALIDRAATLLRTRLRQRADDVLDALAPSLTNATDALNDDAAKLPAGFTAADAANLNPHLFAAWNRVRDAHALIESIHGAVRPLYTVAADGILAPDAVRALRYVEPPEFTNPEHAHQFARALAGIRHGGSSLGPVNIDGVFMPAAVAHLGGTFAFGNATTVSERAEHITAGATPLVVERV